jgi:hypothetical protein
MGQLNAMMAMAVKMKRSAGCMAPSFFGSHGKSAPDRLGADNQAVPAPPRVKQFTGGVENIQPNYRFLLRPLTPSSGGANH